MPYRRVSIARADEKLSNSVRSWLSVFRPKMRKDWNTPGLPSSIALRLLHRDLAYIFQSSMPIYTCPHCWKASSDRSAGWRRVLVRLEASHEVWIRKRLQERMGNWAADRGGRLPREDEMQSESYLRMRRGTVRNSTKWLGNKSRQLSPTALL